MSNLDYKYLSKVVRSAQQGDSDSFAELYAATYQKQYAYACNYLKDNYLAQDALQEIYILVYKNLPTLNDPMVFISWLNQISFRVCFNMMQRQTRTFSDQVVSLDEDATIQPVSEDTPESQVVVIDQQKYIFDQIMALPDNESLAIIYRYYNNMRIDDIASMLHTSKSTVKRLLNSGLDRLRQTIDV
ncbi:MAG: RNA polymerase sigma factor [Lachnospiraceae bacterium]|nr:RNA polymerase sigma factor [Lachnospiraceae bacterium]